MKVVFLVSMIIGLSGNAFAQSQTSDQIDVEKARLAFMHASENYIIASISANSDLNTAKALALGLLRSAASGGLVSGTPLIVPAVTKEVINKYQTEQEIKSAAENLKQEINKAEFLNQKPNISVDFVNSVLNETLSVNEKREKTQFKHFKIAAYAVGGIGIQIVLLPIAPVIDLGALFTESATMPLVVAKGLAVDALGLGALASMFYATEKGYLGGGATAVNPYAGKTVTKLNAPPKLDYEATVKNQKLTVDQAAVLDLEACFIIAEADKKDEKEVGGVAGLTKQELEILQKIQDANNSKSSFLHQEDMVGGRKSSEDERELFESLKARVRDEPPKMIFIADLRVTPAAVAAAKTRVINNHTNCPLVLSPFKTQANISLNDPSLLAPVKLDAQIKKMLEDGKYPVPLGDTYKEAGR